MPKQEIASAVSVEDVRRLARRHLPKIAFDFIEGGVDDEDCISRNELMFRQYRLVPRYMMGNTVRDQSTEIFGQKFNHPFGISPTGAISLFRPGGDLMMAEAAAETNIPFVMSGHSTASIEEMAAVAPQNGWYQMYTARNRDISDDMVRRCIDAGVPALVLTVDVPVQANRERNARNGFSRPLKLSLSTKLEALRHPGWLIRYLKHGNPMFSNWQPYLPAGSGIDAVAELAATQTSVPITWTDIERFRRLWPRAFVIKGIMHPEDARRAADLGVDGLIVSNHGGRQLDRAASPLEVLPLIDAAVGDRVTLMFESGIRRGSDVVVALCLGAKFVFSGRPTLYGAAVAGKAGVSRVLSIFRRELDLVMTQIGATDIASLGRQYLLEHAAGDR